jgi:V8-like Glu-specific endopeptidase
MLRAVALALACSMLAACEPAPVTPIAQPIIGGTLDTGDPAVLALGRFEGTNHLNGCTAFVVSEHVAITAAHCVHDLKAGQSLKLFPGSDARAGVKSLAEWIDVTALTLPDNFNPSGAGSSFDIGLVATSTPLPAAPIALVDQLDQSIVGKTIRLVGYGKTDADDAASSGVKHQVTNTVTALYDDFLVANEPKGYCHGDSGGPELLDVGGQEIAVAIMDRRGLGADGGACETTAHAVRIDIWRKLLIDPFIAAHDGAMAQPDMLPGEGPVEDDAGCAFGGDASGTAGPSLLVAIALVAIATSRLQARRRRRRPRA